MAIELASKYLPYVDEIFTKESKKSLLTNNNFTFRGAAEILLYKVTTAEMNDYGRRGPGEGNWSRYGKVEDLNATTEKFLLKKDRSFTFVIDTLDEDETVGQLSGASALARQLREVVVPEVDSYTYGVMAENAGHKPEAIALTKDNIYDEILKATSALDDAMVPDSERVLLVSPETFRIMKQNNEIIMNTEVGAENRAKGVIGVLDGALVIKVPASRLPENFGFMLAHPIAATAPTKLESYKLHDNPPGINGTLVEGRIVYDAFVPDNKKVAIYYQEQTA